MRTYTKLAAFAVAAVAPLAIAGTAAQASPHPVPNPTTITITHMVNRPDSGGNGNWANDDFTRVLTIRSQGTTALTNCGALNTDTCYAFTADLRDGGSFRTIGGAFTPNQGAPFTGRTLPNHSLTGPMSGNGQFTTFYATSQPNASLVPHTVFGSNDPSSTWPQLAFSTPVTGLSENTFSYAYNTTVVSYRTVTVTKYRLQWVRKHHRWFLERVRYTVTVKVPVVHRENWVDSSSDSSGQVPSAGNITG